jgi:L-threonylcarbamoyladenylate synthase
MNRYEESAKVLEDGGIVVFPTETVYGLAAHALRPEAIEKVYETKNRNYEKPLSLAVPNVETALQYVETEYREEEFMREFLPGPVTVVAQKKQEVPDILTAGKSEVGIRVPNHKTALEMLEYKSPITATSANISGTGSVVDVEKLSQDVKQKADFVIDDGKLDGGTGGTVVNVSENTVHREGAVGQTVREWL